MMTLYVVILLCTGDCAGVSQTLVYAPSKEECAAIVKRFGEKPDNGPFVIEGPGGDKGGPSVKGHYEYQRTWHAECHTLELKP